MVVFKKRTAMQNISCTDIKWQLCLTLLLIILSQCSNVRLRKRCEDLQVRQRAIIINRFGHFLKASTKEDPIVSVWLDV